MKTVRRIALILVSLVVLLIAALLILPRLYKSEIVVFLRSEINQNLDAVVDFDDDVTISLIRHFPNLTIDIQDLSIVGKGAFELDTLVSAQSVAVSIEFMEFVRNGKATITGLRLNEPSVYLTYADSLANWDIFPEDTSESSVSAGVDFDRIIVTDGRFRYLDTAGAVDVSINHLNGTLTGSFKEDVFDAKTQFETTDLYISYDAIPYLNHLPVNGDATMSIDLQNDRYLFKDNQLFTGNLMIVGEGGMEFVNDDDIRYDLTFSSSEASFKELLSLVPAMYLDDVADFEANGSASLSGYFKGLYSNDSFPGYGLKAAIKDGSLRYNKTAKPIQKIALDFGVSCPDGITYHLKLDVPTFSFSLNNEPFSGSLLLRTPETNPYLKGSLKGQVNLADLAALLPADQNRQMKGLLDADVSVDGYPARIESDQLNAMKASGLLRFADVFYNGPEVLKPIEVATARIELDNSKLNIPTLQAKAGSSDLLLSIQLRNIWQYLMGSGTTEGEVNLASSRLDFSDFMEIDTATTESGATSSPIDIPKGIGLALMTNIKQLTYGEENFKNLTASGNLNNQIVTISSMSTEYADGFFKMDGSLNMQNPEQILSDLNLTAERLQISTVFKQFETIRLLAPVAEWASGLFSTTIHLKAPFSGDFSPVLSKLSCKGFLDVFNCDLKGLKIVNEIGQKLQTDQFNKPIKLTDLLLSFKVEDGKVYVEPFELPIGQTKLKLGGYTALDKSIDMTGLLTVPKSLYEQNTQTYLNYIPQDKRSLLGASDITDLLLNLTVGGTVTKPQIKLSYNQLRKNVGDQVKDRINSEIDQRKKEAEDRARAEIDKARADAEQAKKEAEEAAKKAVEAEKKKVEEQIKKEKEELRKKLEEEIKKKRSGVFGK